MSRSQECASVSRHLKWGLEHDLRQARTLESTEKLSLLYGVTELITEERDASLNVLVLEADLRGWGGD